MSANTLSEEILDHVNRLSVDKQKKVLDFVRELERPSRDGISGAELIALAHEINFDPEDLAEMARAIAEAHDGVEDTYEVHFDD